MSKVNTAHGGSTPLPVCLLLQYYFCYLDNEDCNMVLHVLSTPISLPPCLVKLLQLYMHHLHWCNIHSLFRCRQSHTPYLLTSWCRVLLEKLAGLQLVKKFPAFYGTRRFITALTSVRHLSLSWASPIQSIHTHPTSCRSVLILSTHLRIGLPSGLLPSGFPTKTLYTPLSKPIHATCPAITHTALCKRLLSSN